MSRWKENRDREREKNRDMEDMVGDERGSCRRWRRLSVSDGIGVVIVASPVAMVRWVAIMGMRERERERERERKRRIRKEKKTRGWPE